MLSLLDADATPIDAAPPEDPASSCFRDALLAGLARSDKAIPCRFLYDEAGSALFDEICTLPEYYPTRTEVALLKSRAADMAARIGPRARFIELGAGSGGKAEWLIDALEDPAGYVCIDISPVPLATTQRNVGARYPGLPVRAICGDYLGDFALPAMADSRDVCFFPGSTIGNFERPEARAFLANWRQRLNAGAMMLVGVDLKKDIATLEAAYDDAQGVTARFSLNVLERANRELGSDFDTRLFRHRARYVADPGHIEISLVSQVAQTVSVAGHRFAFAAGEAVHIENSHKYSVQEFTDLAAGAGFAATAVWTDPSDMFSIHLLQATH